MSIDTIYQDADVTVTTDDYVDGNLRFAQGIFKVKFTGEAKAAGCRGKTFKGEMAWSDSRRYVEDQLQNKARIIFRGYW